jgi:UPF0716 protein FxsA
MFVLLLILVPAVEILALIEVADAIGWPLALILLVATSLIGARLLRSLARTATERLSLAVAERRAPEGSAFDGALRFLGGVLLVVPGFVTDVLGALLLVRPTRTLTRLWISRHYAGRVISFATSAAPFASGSRRMRPADVEGTAVDDDERPRGLPHSSDPLGPRR